MTRLYGYSFSLKHGGVSVSWVPGRRRLLATTCGPLLYEVCSILFLVTRIHVGDRYRYALKAFKCDSLEPDSPVWRLIGPNIINAEVCLGSAVDAVLSGRLDPVEAFWMTTFEVIEAGDEANTLYPFYPEHVSKKTVSEVVSREVALLRAPNNWFPIGSELESN